MTEDEWLTTSDPVALLAWLESSLIPTQRKLQLFVTGCCRLVGPHVRPQVQQLIVAAENLADISLIDQRYGQRHSSQFHDALLALWRETLPSLEEEVRSLTSWSAHGIQRASACGSGVRSLCPPSSPAGQAELVRELFGNPFRKVRQVGTLLQGRVQTWDKQPNAVLFVREWRTWEDGTIVQLAHGIYEERAFDRMPYLADALEDAGCAETAILEHCRAQGPHVRGCWVLDLLLDR